MSDDYRKDVFAGSELEHVTEPGPCPLCGRMTLRKDTGGTWCPDEDSTCWRGGDAAVEALRKKRSEDACFADGWRAVEGE